MVPPSTPEQSGRSGSSGKKSQIAQLLLESKKFGNILMVRASHHMELAERTNRKRLPIVVFCLDSLTL
jgi:hypothetical protein